MINLPNQTSKRVADMRDETLDSQHYSGGNGSTQPRARAEVKKILQVQILSIMQIKNKKSTIEKPKADLRGILEIIKHG